ncbi:hypothetical protein Cgig2_007709 [Carnegiea gigantea]|uniref:NB-ARC domain-containing protein n=1 Tax=Carnegiea gigantea TaxID=171969 RepID=A0A9Q1K9H1_9CARY|nr:hypothetical protein Cgig2_007709 [Carnegiea gigantea]
MESLQISATGRNHEDLALEPLHKKLWEQLEGKKYLLVLDDLWNENRLQWLELIKYLTSNVRGSWILVTTRSEKTATIVEHEHIYKLEGLSKEDSWCIFDMTAFGQRYGQQCPSDLVEIGQGIGYKSRYVVEKLEVPKDIGLELHGNQKSPNLDIEILENAQYAKENVKEGGYIRSKGYIKWGKMSNGYR